jgi:drug/metabolite transporter (DMT)-like permease
MLSARITGLFSAIGAFALWSTLAIFFNLVSLPVSFYLGFGSLLAFVILLIYFLLTKRRFSGIKFSWFLVGVLLIAATKGLVWFNALKLYPVAPALLIANLAPAVAAILAPLFIKEKASFQHFLAIGLGFLGLAVILNNQLVSFALPLGAILALITAVMSGLQDIFHRFLSKTMTGLEQALIFTFGQTVGGMFFFRQHWSVSLLADHFIELSYFALLGSVVPFILFFNSFKSLKSFEVATIGYVEPVLAAILAYIFLTQPITLATIFGGLMIFGSGLILIKAKH